MGLGLNDGGVGAARFFAKAGARVLVTDLKNRRHLAPSIQKLSAYKNISYVLGKHRIQDFQHANLVIQGPGVPSDSPYLAIAHKHRVPIDTDIGIFFRLCPAPIIGVTGSKGKSTTASLIQCMLATAYPNVLLAGNIGRSVFDILPRLTKHVPVVLELSSWQLEGLAAHTQAPHIAVITNILYEHLNRYKSFADYARAKSFIARFQKKQDILIMPHGDRVVRNAMKGAPSRIIAYAVPKIPHHEGNARLFGAHNAANIAAAVSVARLFRIPTAKIKKALRTFPGNPGRMEPIRLASGVRYYNDTTATMPDATIAAIKTLAPARKHALLLIAGGTDKNLRFADLANVINREISVLILLPGTATKQLLRSLPPKPRPTIIKARTMRVAVAQAHARARKGDIVLLSPGAASFGLFQNEFDRGAQFNNAVKKL